MCVNIRSQALAISLGADMRELDPALFGPARVVVDQREAALSESG
jgi:ornithine cyclodeaminase/alanine dehydrogenase-like protein (mu-crystallin family)